MHRREANVAKSGGNGVNMEMRTTASFEAVLNRKINKSISFVEPRRATSSNLTVCNLQVISRMRSIRSFRSLGTSKTPHGALREYSEASSSRRLKTDARHLPKKEIL